MVARLGVLGVETTDSAANEYGWTILQQRFYQEQRLCERYLGAGGCGELAVVLFVVLLRRTTPVIDLS